MELNRRPPTVASSMIETRCEAIETESGMRSRQRSVRGGDALNHAPFVAGVILPAVATLLGPLTVCSTPRSGATASPFSGLTISTQPLPLDHERGDRHDINDPWLGPAASRSSLSSIDSCQCTAPPCTPAASGPEYATVILIAGFTDGGDNRGAVTHLSRPSRVWSNARYGAGTSDPPPGRAASSSSAPRGLGVHASGPMVASRSSGGSASRPGR